MPLQLKQLRGRMLQWGITSACSMGFLLFGYDQGVMGTVINSRTFKKQFKNPSAMQQGLITGLYNVGCFIGSLFAFWFGEKLGRKISIYVGSVIVIMGTILQVTSTSVAMIIFSRILTGIGIGIKTAVVPVWAAEVAPAHMRGAMLTIEAIMIIVGFATSNWVSFGASFASSDFQWKFPIAVQCIPAIYLLLAGPFLVESPRWLANQRDINEATAVLARLLDTTEDDPRVQSSRAQIQAALELEKGGSFKEFWKANGQQHLRRALLSIGALYFQQMSGINTVGYYLPVILEEEVGLSNRMASIVAGCGSLWYLLSSLPPYWFIDRVGRRSVMMAGAAAMAVINALLPVAFRIPGTPGKVMVVVLYFLYYSAFALTLLNAAWIYPPEINSLQMRSMGAALASMSNWLFNGVSATVAPQALHTMGGNFYIIFAILNASFVPIIYFCYPETKGLQLEQIDHIFENRYPKGFGHFTDGVRESIQMTKNNKHSSDEEKGPANNNEEKSAGEDNSSEMNLRKTHSVIEDGKEVEQAERASIS